MRNPESIFRHTVSEGLRRRGGLAQAIESDITGAGIPDLYVIFNSKSAWVECKVMRGTLRSTISVPFRPGQYGWLYSHSRFGGTSIVAIRFDDADVYTLINNIDRDTYRIIDIQACKEDIIQLL